MKNALITTTIHTPYNLEAYAKDIKEYGPEDTTIIVAGDLKTPPSVGGFVNQLALDYGIETIYFNPADQDKFLTNLGFEEYKAFLPWNCIQRRNVAILCAYHDGAEIIATIDDDNLWEGEGYFNEHGALGQQENLEVFGCPGSWFNVCAGAQTQNKKGFYPRGFSFRHRGKQTHTHETIHRTGRRVVNGGLWTGDPDIDAVTRMALAPDVENYEITEYRLTLDHKTLCPFNSQNTALHRGVIPAYCMATGLGRYDDIIASYIVKRIADHLGDYISFGEPIVRQVRNKHDLWKDLEEEKIGMQLIDVVVDWLYQIPLSGHTYKECIVELIHDFEEKTLAWAEGNPLTDQVNFMHSIIVNYKHWMKVT